MKVIVQKAINAKCIVDGNVIGSIENGYMLLVGFTVSDTISNVLTMANKVKNLRIFEDDNGKMNLSIVDVNGTILSISQFTLYADASKGNRPSFVNAMNASDARALYDSFNEKLRDLGLHVETGKFQEHMKIEFTNDGPITIVLEN